MSTDIFCRVRFARTELSLIVTAKEVFLRTSMD